MPWVPGFGAHGGEQVMHMANGQPKVVPFKSDSDGSRPVSPPLPQVLLRLQERFFPALQERLQPMFDEADDALFELADRAASNLEQNAFFESMREVRVRRRDIEQGMARRLRQGLQQLVQELPAPVDAEASRAGELSLVEHDELEQLVAADSMAAKGEKRYAEVLQLLTLRLDALATRQKLTVATNPLAPGPLCRYFIDECQPLAIDIKAKLVLFKLFDRRVMAELEPLYQLANELLAEAGLLPGLSSRDLARQPQRTTVPDRAATATGEALYSQLSTLLAPLREGSTAGSLRHLAAPGAAPVLSREGLLPLLLELQQRQLQQLTGAGESASLGSEQLDLQRGVDLLLASAGPEGPVSLGRQDDDALRLVSLLFQFILEDRNLPAPIKGLLVRLQIPVLRLALQDKAVFNRSGHPARRLLNEVANASLGWVPEGAPEQDPFYQRIEGLVNRILDEFDGEDAPFKDALADFLSQQELEQRRIQLVERRTIDAEDGRVRAELARQAVQAELDRRVSGRTLPRAMVRLLEEGWSHVLFLTYLRDGADSRSWQEATALVDELLDSVRPTLDAAERTLLIRRLPALLEQLRDGLNRIGFDPHEMNRLFADLEQVHLARLQQAEPDREAQAPEPPRPQPGEESPSLAVVPPAPVAAPEAKEPPTDLAGPEPSEASRNRVQALRSGCWVEYHSGDGRITRCRLAAFIRATGKYIFVSRAGVKVAEETVDSLARQLDGGQVVLLDDGQLFDRALESVIGNLREMNRRR